MSRLSTRLIPTKETHKTTAGTKPERASQTGPPGAAGRLTSRERRLQEARQLTLFSDAFASVVFKDRKACQHVLRILTGDRELWVTEVRTQYRISRISSRDAVLDVLAEDSRRRLYNLELQRPRTMDHARRVRFYGSVTDGEFVEKGTEYADLPDVSVIYVSETDIWHGKSAAYCLEKSLVRCGKRLTPKGGSHDGAVPAEMPPERIVYDDGRYVRYVNAAVDDGTEIAGLMRYFKTADPLDMSHGALSERVHYLKCEEGGRKEMCEVTERWRQEDLREGRQEGLREGLREGLLRGRRQGKRQGIAQGEMKRARLIALNLYAQGEPADRIARTVMVNVGQVRRWIADGGKV